MGGEPMLIVMFALEQCGGMESSPSFFGGGHAKKMFMDTNTFWSVDNTSLKKRR